MSYDPDADRRSALNPQNPGLAGTRRVADELYLIAHHENTGRPYLPPRSLGVGMAGGLLAELMAAQAPAVTVDRGHVVPLCSPHTGQAAGVRPDEPVAGRVLDLIMAESPPRLARDWLLFLGSTSAAQVAGRLERSGYLIRPPGRVPWRASRPVPADGDWSVCALLRARAALDAARVLTPYSALLTGLTVACGLGFRFSDLPGAPGRTAAEATRVLPRPLQELIAHVQVTADNIVLSARK